MVGNVDISLHGHTIRITFSLC